MSVSQTLYNLSPYWLQNILLNAYSFRIHRERYGEPFMRAMSELEKSQWYTPDQIYDYQSKRLVALVKHAYDTAPFYRKHYDNYGVSPDNIKELSDIVKLPLVSRDDIHKDGHDLISSRYSRNMLIHGHTSGTTGSPLSFYWDKQTCVYTNAVDWRQKKWAGVNYGDKIALFLGRTIVPTNKINPPFWQEDKIHNMLWMSSFHLSDKYMQHHLNKLKNYRPDALEGYPSTIYILARYLRSVDETLPVKAVFTSSETLLPIQRELIEERFKAPVFDFYGLAERVAFASQCAELHEYHLNFEYAINEIVDGKGRSVAEGDNGYLVGTSLFNYAMPFIRYKSNDITSLSSGQCKCGRHMTRFNGVTTKEEDIVVTPEGKLVSSSILTHPFKPLDAVEESQIIQDQVDSLKVRIVQREGYSKSDSVHLISALQERVGPTMRIELEFVDRIPRTKSGKLRWVISKVPLPL